MVPLSDVLCTKTASHLTKESFRAFSCMSICFMSPLDLSARHRHGAHHQEAKWPSPLQERERPKWPIDP
jgi:hypothetical protein